MHSRCEDVNRSQTAEIETEVSPREWGTGIPIKSAGYQNSPNGVFV